MITEFLVSSSEESISFTTATVNAMQSETGARIPVTSLPRSSNTLVDIVAPKGIDQTRFHILNG